MSYTMNFNTDAVLKRVRGATAQAMEAEVAIVAAEARRLCPVGSAERALPKRYFLTNSRAVRKATGMKFKRDEGGRLISKEYKGVPESWRARTPGTLRDSIYTKVRWKNGVCLGFVKAGYDQKRREGNPNAFYARFVEYGTKKMPAKPFMRPAGAKARPSRIGAAMKGVLN